MKEFNKKSLGWLFGFIKKLAEALESHRRFYPLDDDIDKLKQLYKQIISQSERQVDEKYIDEKANELYERCMCKESVRHTQYGRHQFTPKEAKDFIRSIVQEIQKPRKEEK